MQKSLKILVIMTKKIGDTLLCTPLLNKLRNQYPQAQIDMLAKDPAAQILKRNPDISRLHIINKTLFPRLINEIRRQKYQYIIDLYPTETTALISALSGAPNRIRGYFLKKRLYHYIYNIRPDYYAIKEEYTPNRHICLLERILFKDIKSFPPLKLILPPNIERIKNTFFRKYSIRPQDKLIAFIPQGSHPLKMWPPHKWVALANLINRQYKNKVKIFLFTDKNGKKFSDSLSAIGADNIFTPECKNLEILSSFISFMDIAVTVCTGTKHIAVALNIPTITLQTITNPFAWHPIGNPKHTLVSAPNLKCLYCDKTLCNPDCAPCIKNLTPEIVFNQLIRTLK